MTTTVALHTERLRTGRYITRPAGQLGTIGWVPFPWEAVVGPTPALSRKYFIEAHQHHLTNHTRTHP